VVLQSWRHAQRRRVQLLNEREEVLLEGQQRGIALNPSETYTRVAAGARGHFFLGKLVSRAPLRCSSGLFLGNEFWVDHFCCWLDSMLAVPVPHCTCFGRFAGWLLVHCGICLFFLYRHDPAG